MAASNIVDDERTGKVPQLMLNCCMTLEFAVVVQPDYITVAGMPE
jgi:hypothetical protein